MTMAMRSCWAMVAFWTSAAVVAWGAAVTTTQSGNFRLDLRKGMRLAVTGAEEISVSGRWEGHAATATADGVVIATAEAGEEKTVEWLPENSGLHVLQHASGENVLEASFTMLAGDVAVHAGSIAGSEVWEEGTVHVVDGTVVVGNGVALTIERGAVVKFSSGSALVVASGGTCMAEGVVFTHIHDDTAGGDTMGDGDASLPEVDAYSVNGSLITDAATELRWITDKTSGTLTGNTVWMGNRVICVTGDVAVANGGTLTVMPGAVVKFAAGKSLTVNGGGTLNAIGTRAQPIVFTSVKDDEYGGDTNGDGDATTAQPGDWGRIYAGGTVNMDYCRIRHCNNNGDHGAIHGTGGTVRFDDGVIEYSAYECVRMNSNGTFRSSNSVFRESSMAFGYRGGSGTYVYNGVVADCTVGCRAKNKHFYNTVFYRCQEFTDQNGDASEFDHCVFYNPEGGGAQSYAKVGQNGNIWGDPLFLDADRGDFRVAEGSPCVDAADSAVAPDTDFFGQPRASAFGEAVADIGIYEVQPRGVAGDVDLVTVAVSAEAEAMPGGELRVSWEVGNRGGKVASGSRRDAVSLVSAGGREVSLGEKVFSQSVAAGGTVKCEAVFRVPPMAEGTWWPKVVVNSQQDIFEGSLIANNARTGETGVEVSLPATAAASGASGTVAAGVPTVLKLHFEAGDGNRMVVLNVPQGVSVAWGFGFVPAAGGAGGTSGPSGTGGTAGASWTAESSGAPVQFVAPDGVEDVYVVLESGEAGAYEVSTESGKLAVTSVEPGEVPSSGEATLAVSGAGFMPGAAVKLKGNGATIAAESVRVVDSRTISATVDCGKLAAGAAYDLVVESADATASAGKAVHVAAAPGEGKFWARLDVPGSVREGRKVSCSVEYGNSGNADMAAPVIQIDMKGNGTLGYVDGLQGVKTLQFVAAGEEGSAGVLRPGAERRIRFELLAGKDNRMTLHTSMGSGYAPEPWGSAEEYFTDLSAAATRVGLRGRDATDYEEVVELARAVKAGEATSVICGRIVDFDGSAIAGAVLSFSNKASGGILSVVSGEDGGFITAVAEAGEYDIGCSTFLLSRESTVVLVSEGQDSHQLLSVARSGVYTVTVQGGVDGLSAVALEIETDTTHIGRAVDGGFEFRGLPDGSYRVTLFQGEDAVFFGRLGIENGQAVTERLEYDGCNGATLVLSTDTTCAANGAGFYVLSSESGYLGFVCADEETGMATMKLPAGIYDVMLAGSAAEVAPSENVTLLAGETRSIHLESPEAGASSISKTRMPAGEGGVTNGRLTRLSETGELKKRMLAAWEKACQLEAVPLNPPTGERDCIHNRELYKFFKGYRDECLAVKASYRQVFLDYEEAEKAFIFQNNRMWVGILKDSYVLLATGAFKVLGYVFTGLDMIFDQVVEGNISRGTFFSLLENAGIPVISQGGKAAVRADVVYRTLKEFSARQMFEAIFELHKSAMRDFNLPAMELTNQRFEQFLINTDNYAYRECCPLVFPETPYAPPEETKQPQVPQSWDPNEMEGPLGAGAARLVAPGEWMTYTVYFENKAEATAAAQEVYVTEQLGGALDWSTFEMVDVGFNNQLDLGLGGKRKGSSVTAMTGTAYKVRTELDYNAKTGAAKWYMRIVDESTETRWPRDVYAGFLPPNDATGRGEGHITYRVKLRDDAAAGTVVRASANIVFDYNAAIETDPAWWNTVAEMGTATVDLGNGVSTNVTVMVGAPWIGQLPDPGKRPGMRFAGWFTGPNGTGTAVTEESVAAAGAKLYAFWDATAAPELWLDVSWGAVEIGTNGVVKGYGRDGEAAEGMANRYVLTGTSRVNGVKFAGGSFTNTWTNLVINLNAKDAVAVTLEGASVEVTLEGDSSIASGEDCAGVRVDAASALVLQGAGRLAAQGGKCGAGIGGGKLQESGRVEIRAGTVEATGGEYGAGIGGGLVAPAAGAVVIAGGSVRARGSDGGKDIGGGFGREGTGAPVGAAGTPVHEVEVPLATDALPAEVVVDLGGGKTYRYAGPGHEGDTSLWFWLPDGTYEFAADVDEYGAHVDGAPVAAVFTDPASEHFGTPAFETVEATADGWRVGLNPAYRTTPFELWTATGLDRARAWAWKQAEAGEYRFDAETGAVEWLGGATGVRVFRFRFRARE